MRSQFIKEHIDKVIVKQLDEKDYDSTRDTVLKTVTSFKSKIEKYNEEKNLDLTLLNSVASIEKIDDSRLKYLLMYVFFAENRIIDLYKVERKFKKFNFSPQKSFKLWIFKENVEKGGFKSEKKK